jgi:hypothetical protein
MAGFGAGWQTHLESLREHAEHGLAVDREALHERLRPSYDERIMTANT